MSLQNGKCDIEIFLNQNQFSVWQKRLLLFCFLIVLIDGFDTVAIGFVAPSLMSEWKVARADLAPVLSAALFGLAFGAISAGYISDKWGRKNTLTASVAIMGIASILSAFSENISQLTIWRFICGLGLGAAMPNAVTLINEYCPANKRALITNIMFCGFPIGTACGGFLAAWLIPAFGWRSILMLGGILPIIMLPIMIWKLPESVRYLIEKNEPVDNIKKYLLNISDKAKDIESFVKYKKENNQKDGIKLVFSSEYIVGTIMLCVAYFMGLVVVYGLVNWMPILFSEAGIKSDKAAILTAVFQIGGIGAIWFGYLMDRFNANYVITAGYGATFLLVALIGQTLFAADTAIWLLIFVVTIAGFAMNATQASMQALAANYYPTRARASGVGTMLSIGRFGGIAGSYLIAWLGVLKLDLPMVFVIVAIPALIASVALLIKNMRG